MAIKAKITTIQGINLTEAYINIQNPQIQKVKTETGNIYKFGGNACVYASKTAYEAGKIPVEGFSVVCELDLDGNIMEQAYVELANNERLENVTND
jgi:hypothetical protein